MELLAAMNIDGIFAEIGDLGPQQQRYTACITSIGAYSAFIMLQYTFVGYALPFRCVGGGGGARDGGGGEHVGGAHVGGASRLSADACDAAGNGHLRSRCPSGIKFNTTAESTIVSEWDLVCDRAWMAPLTMSVFMAGVMSGATPLGTMADALGRKRTLSFALFAMLLANGFSACVTSFGSYLILRFLCGFFQSGVIITSFVLNNELVGSSKRALVGNAQSSGFGVGIAVFAIVAYFVRPWRQLTAVTTAAGIPLLALHCYLPESPHWLLGKGRSRDAVAVLRNIAVKNGNTWLNYKLAEDHQKGSVSVVGGGGGGGDRVTDLFRDRGLATLSVIQIFSWFVNSAAYYGLTLSAGAGDDAGARDRYTATALSGLVELPSYALSLLLLSVGFGRRTTLAGFMIAGGAGLVVAIALGQAEPGLIVSGMMFSKLCIAASFALAYIHSGEIFPTSIRNTALGMVGVAARIGGIVAPFLTKLGNFYPNLHLIFFGVSMLTAGFLNLKLPETKGRPLPKTIGDLLRRLRGPRRAATDADDGGRYKNDEDKVELLADQEEGDV